MTQIVVTRVEVAVLAGLAAGGSIWQLLREALGLTTSPADPMWLAFLFATLLVSLATYGIIVSMFVAAVQADNKAASRARATHMISSRTASFATYSSPPSAPGMCHRRDPFAHVGA
eukprot:CAMPEP_0182939346 /NCGR_PEP_ID=MMETSP0105_2-20130417/45472_1 /TAXON_ID=81532 ORGANISM="Acanthoeca-like sp., Strain 10tr" /NCGR_SAMPLE_ID=MMETSP0105_2 /ASSEMBLY_ACC=CAM_ASM_000205 /LENGTH=115 /DNA_ID=CAMNT_0025078733 /DNA_START=79 /DNA_END=426 /DNA_ORIENTATION=+